MNPQNPFHRNPSQFGDIASFLRRTKKWYLIPIVIVLAVVGLLIVLGGTAAAPFVYTLF